jgi:hypothetical protein
LWIGLIIAAVIFLLCCIALVVGILLFNVNIPIISGLFASPTPVNTPTPIPSPTLSGLFYNNPSAGLSLTYPLSWQYVESGDAETGYTIYFASSEEILNNISSAPQTGAAMAVLTKIMTTSDLSFAVDANSMGDVLEYIATQYFTNISQGQNLRLHLQSGYPAASAVYSMTTDTGIPTAALLITVLRNEDILLFFGVCPQSEWSQHKITFNDMMNSLNLVSP